MTKDAPLYIRIARKFDFGAFNLLVLGLCACAVLLFLVQAWRWLPVTGDNVYPEAAGVLSALRWSHGLSLYENYQQPPYLITPFPPLWYTVAALAAKAGASAMDSLTLFARMFSLVSLFGIAAASYLWNRRIGYSVRVALIAPALFLSLPILSPWAVSARPDFPALLACIVCLYWISFRKGAAWISLAAAVAAMAFLIKHNTVAVPVAVVLWMLWGRRIKDAVIFCVAWGVVVGGTLATANYASHGMLALNLSGAKFGHLAFTYAHDVIGRLFYEPGHGFALLLLAFGAIGFLVAIDMEDKRYRLLCIYAVTAAFFAMVGAAAAGSAVNHCLEAAMVMAIAAPTGAAFLQRNWSSESLAGVFAGIVVLLLAGPALDVQRANIKHVLPEDSRPLIPVINAKQIFTDIPFLAARSGQPEMLDMASFVNAERITGHVQWSESVARDLSRKRYDLVILNEPLDMPYNLEEHYPRYPHLTPALKSAIGANYTFCFLSGTSSVYVPVSTSLSPDGCTSLKSAAMAGIR